MKNLLIESKEEYALSFLQSLSKYPNLRLSLQQRSVLAAHCDDTEAGWELFSELLAKGLIIEHPISRRKHPRLLLDKMVEDGLENDWHWSNLNRVNIGRIFRATNEQGEKLFAKFNEKTLKSFYPRLVKEIPEILKYARFGVDAQITLSEIKENQILASTDMCSICHDEFCEAKDLTFLPCKHLFHTLCIYNAVQHCSECLYCRKSI